MSLRAHIWAWRQPTQSTAERCVLAYLGEAHCQADGSVVKRAVDTIADKVHMTPRNVMRVTAALADRGLIEIVRRGRGNCNHYVLNGLDEVTSTTDHQPDDVTSTTGHEADEVTSATGHRTYEVTSATGHEAGAFPDEVTFEPDDVTSERDEVTFEPDDVSQMSPSPVFSGITPVSPSPAAPDSASSKQKTSGTEAAQVVDHLNAIAGSRFKVSPTSTRWINGRLHDGHTVADLIAVIDFKARDWLGDPAMRQYLRPATLFRPGKFEAYLAAARSSGRSEHPAVAAERLRQQREAEAAANPDRRECENCSGGGCLVCGHRGWHPAKAVAAESPRAGPGSHGRHASAAQGGGR